ncbi:hypothetical protein P67b_00025 [Ruegeria phage Tedan]|nr:hypothetical protein P67b_00025 [Ruegeria phage Tedan]
MWVAEDLELVRIYYQRGNVKGSTRNYEVQDPPTSGWQNALIIRGEKRSTIFCPFSLEAWTVRNSCAEITDRRDIKHDHSEWNKLQEILVRNWDLYQSLGMGKNYETAALVFKKMGVKAPEQKIKGGDLDTRVKGGKDVGSKLKKPVKLSSKRGRFLAWFLGNGGTASVREAMAEFTMTRSNALSYLYMIQKDHGIGYVLTGDVAALTLPEGCTNPFDEDWGDLDDGDDDWLDTPENTEDDDDWLD